MIVGIDLGTTNSLIAYFTEDGPKIIPNRLGKHLTPSVVSVDEEGNVYVGETAKERMSLYPNSVAETFKRSMGTDREYILSGRHYKPEELSSFVLRALKEDAEHYLGEEVTEAVISVPAYFDDKRRKATKRAGELAGLKVERMISEPTAAAVAYGLYDKTRDTRFLVFDLGGGTFDVSVLELYHNILEVRAVAGDNYLGGEDFTEVMAKLFLQKAKLQLSALTEKEQVRLYRQAEKAKREIYTTATSEHHKWKEVADFYSNDAEGWGVYSQKVLIKNNSKTAIVVANAQSDANGSGNMWIFSRASDLNYITVLPGESGEFSFNVLVKGYSSEKEIRAQLKKLAPTIVYAENKNAANQSFVKFDMTNAEKFTLDIKF